MKVRLPTVDSRNISTTRRLQLAEQSARRPFAPGHFGHKSTFTLNYIPQTIFSRIFSPANSPRRTFRPHGKYPLDIPLKLAPAARQSAWATCTLHCCHFNFSIFWFQFRYSVRYNHGYFRSDKQTVYGQISLYVKAVTVSVDQQTELCHGQRHRALV